MRGHAQRILEESEAQRAQTEAEFEIQLATRREQAERQEAERLAAAQSATQKFVFEAEQRASTAEERAAKANAQADQTRRDADQHARQLVGNAEKNADQIAGQAKTQAEQLLAEVNADAERRRAATHREVDDLTRQKDSIASHLAQVRQLLPGMNAVQAAQTKPAITGDPNK
jgi:paraquat-inducible protein B